MNRLARRISTLIETHGPVSIAQFMIMALHDPSDGYYATRQPIGEAGDFITAPEISQIFGELLGLWIVQAWRDQGCPSPARLVELGPGRGTLMADALRAARVDPKFLSSIEVVLVEASATLREQQAATLEKTTTRLGVRWIERFDDSPADRPLFLLANEFFDALPIRQFILTERGWGERMVGIDKDGELTFALAPVAAMPAIASERGLPDMGAVYETSPAAESIVAQIAHAIASKGGAALIVDYGYGADAGFGETLQAVAEHKFAQVLDQPGEADLSAHVDFAALARATELGGARAYGPVEQSLLLQSLGISARADRLMQANREQRDAIAAAVERLVSPQAMGRLFKALAIMPKRAPRPPGF